MIKTINIALLGFGTIGSGTYEVIEKRQKETFPHKVGAEVKVKWVYGRHCEMGDVKPQLATHTAYTCDWQDIIQDKDVDIIVELMGGIEPAKSYILEALKAGKHVVTANKDLIADHGQELFKTAADHHCDFMFEASALGAIPIIQPIKEDLAANHLSELVGIMNGTTNYILTKMTTEGWDFDQALAEATRLGFAEADPTADIEGYDAGRKVAILATIAFHTPVTFADVSVEGISKISSKDMEYAERLGCVIKLLGLARRQEQGIELQVYPALISKQHPLASVNDAFNAIFIKGDAVDEVMFYGHGAGRLPTASAVVGDVINICRNLHTGSVGRVSDYSYDAIPLLEPGQSKSRFFLRMQVADNPGVLAKIGYAFGQAQVSIAQVIQGADSSEEKLAELVIITHEVEQAAFEKAVEVVANLDDVISVESKVRAYGPIQD